MENRSEFVNILEKNLSLSFLKNSCTGSSIEVERQVEERQERVNGVDDRPTITTSATNKIKKKSGGSGGYNCI